MAKPNTTTDRDAERRRIARYLADNGPVRGDDLAKKLGLTSDHFWRLINCAWFGIVTGGWTLTERGRAESLSPPALSPAKRPDQKPKGRSDRPGGRNQK